MEPLAIVYACGVHSLGLALFHAAFWRIFRWRHDLQTSSLPTRAIIQIANLRLIHVFLLAAVLCFGFPDELLQTNLGRTYMIGMALFWLGRTIEQFIFLPYNRFFVHLLTAVFLLGAVLFALPVLL